MEEKDGQHPQAEETTVPSEDKEYKVHIEKWTLMYI